MPQAHLLRRCVLTQIILALGVSPALAASGYLNIAVNDSATHYAIPALVKVDGPEIFTVPTDEFGRLKRAVPPGEYRFEVSAPGYKNMKSHTTVESGKTAAMIFMLDPANPPEEERLLESRLRPGFSLVHGYATERGRPVRDVQVRLQKAGAKTTTDHRGYYWLSVPTPPETSPGVPDTDTLIAEKPGYKTIIHRNMIVASEDAGGFYLGMERGSGVVEFDDTHKLMRKRSESVDEHGALPPAPAKTPRELYDWLGAAGVPFPVAAVSNSAAVSPQAVTIPATIKVGLNCTDQTDIETCNTCSLLSG